MIRTRTECPFIHYRCFVCHAFNWSLTPFHARFVTRTKFAFWKCRMRRRREIWDDKTRTHTAHMLHIGQCVSLIDEATPRESTRDRVCVCSVQCGCQLHISSLSRAIASSNRPIICHSEINLIWNYTSMCSPDDAVAFHADQIPNCVRFKTHSHAIICTNLYTMHPEHETPTKKLSPQENYILWLVEAYVRFTETYTPRRQARHDKFPIY